MFEVPGIQDKAQNYTRPDQKAGEGGGIEMAGGVWREVGGAHGVLLYNAV